MLMQAEPVYLSYESITERIGRTLFITSFVFFSFYLCFLYNMAILALFLLIFSHIHHLIDLPKENIFHFIQKMPNRKCGRHLHKTCLMLMNHTILCP